MFAIRSPCDSATTAPGTAAPSDLRVTRPDTDAGNAAAACLLPCATFVAALPLPTIGGALWRRCHRFHPTSATTTAMTTTMTSLRCTLASYAEAKCHVTPAVRLCSPSGISSNVASKWAGRRSVRPTPVVT